MLFISFRLQDMFRVIPRRSAASGVGFALLSLLAAPTAFGQTAGNQAQTSQGSPPRTIRIQVRFISGFRQSPSPRRKSPTTFRTFPVSVTAVTGETLESAGISSVSEAAQVRAEHVLQRVHGPQAEQSAIPRYWRQSGEPGRDDLSSMVYRSSTRTPRVSSCWISTRLNSSAGRRARCSAETRLAASSTSRAGVRRSRAGPAARRCPFGNFGRRDARQRVGTARGQHVALGVGIGYSQRDGFTTNVVTGHDLDSRSAVFRQGPALWTPAAHWEARVISAASARATAITR